MLVSRDYVAPHSLDEVLQLLDESLYTVLAGGTDVYPARVGKPLPERVVDLSLVENLRGIVFQEGFWRIGATTTWSDIVNAKLPTGFECLQQAAKQIGAVQVQNAGTISGNLCTASPAGDSIPALMALDAEVELMSVSGVRRLKIEDFIAGYRKTVLQTNEIVTSINVPSESANSTSAFEKFGTRAYLVISLVMVATSVRRNSEGKIKDLRICVGACSPVAKRIRTLENRLVKGGESKQSLDQITIEDFSILSPIDDIRCSSEYRFELLPVLVKQALEHCGWNSNVNN